MSSVAIWTILHVSAVAAAYNWQQDDDFSWNQIRDIDDEPNLLHTKIKTREQPQSEGGPFHIVVSFFQPIVNAFHLQLSAPALRPSINDSHLPLHVRVKRAKRRKLIVKCCGRQSCTDVSSSNSERVSQVRRKKQDEAEFVSDLQYSRPKKKRKKMGADLTNLQAFGVFTDSGIHISCAGCPAGWPEMLTVYPEYEIGIPVSCSNCPNNWPGALNLLGMGGDTSWQQQPQSGRNPGRGRGGNNFYAFDTESNFGSRPGNVGVFPPSDFGNNFGGGGGGDEQDYNDTPPPKRRPKKKGSTEAPTDEGDGEEEGDAPSEVTTGASAKKTKKPAPTDDEEDEQDDEYEEAAPNKGTTSAAAAAASEMTKAAAAGNVTTEAASAAGKAKTTAAGDDDEEAVPAATTAGNAAKDATTTAKDAAATTTKDAAATVAKNSTVASTTAKNSTAAAKTVKNSAAAAKGADDAADLV